MNVRSLFLLLLIFAFCETKAQDYSVIYTHPNSVGQPGQLFLSQVKVHNSSTEGIFMHFERIVNNLPGTWTSCFCYPFCVAPWIDTASFYVNGSATDSIMPNFGTDSIPAMATVTIVLYQVGYENVPDTITFTGTTLPAGIATPVTRENISVYPNPFADVIMFNNPTCGISFMSIRNSLGEIVFTQNITSSNPSVNLEFLPRGMYFAELRTESDEIFTTIIIKAQ